ncbi:UDP-N-acetylmuramoyl-tripeptide--D-alanyl-D-alanine ligase, partial [candidate division KSB1 bacterium]|nr:UDP-N-acetylmuramoyl-tripeptide--D-alanyl-D-alanine ligase [candidate division KSB1 bacterium]
EIRRLTEIVNPNYGLITNIGRGHLEFLGNLEGVAREKTELFRAVAEQGTAFVNVDDPFLFDCLPWLKRSIRYGIKTTADVSGKFLGVNQSGAVRFQVRDQEISLRAPGMHNMYNALAAISVGLEFGIPLSEMQTVFATFESHSKRMQVIEHQGITILNDCYNANPDSMEAALAVLQQIRVPGRKLAVVADMLELGKVARAEHQQVGQKMAQMPLDYVLGYGTLTLDLINAVRKNSMMVAEHFTDKNQLIQTLLKRIQPGDLVLIKGSRGMAMEAVTQALLEWQDSPILVPGN